MTAERLKNVDAVLFDLDGTLIDTVELILDSFRYATREVLGVELPDDVLMEQVGCPLPTQMRSFSEEHADTLVSVYREYNARVHDEMIREYPGVLPVLDALRDRGVPMGVVTSKSHAVAQRGLDVFGMSGYFQTLVAFDDVEKHKPDPFPLVAAASRMGVDLRKSVYLGDSPYDMIAALAGDAVAVAALWGAFPRQAVLGPCPHFALEEMPELLLLLDGEPERFEVRGCR